MFGETPSAHQSYVRFLNNEWCQIARKRRCQIASKITAANTRPKHENTKARNLMPSSFLPCGFRAPASLPLVRPAGQARYGNVPLKTETIGSTPPALNMADRLLCAAVIRPHVSQPSCNHESTKTRFR